MNAGSAALDRKNAPAIADAVFHDFCMGLWAKSRQQPDRKQDTWIGLTVREGSAYVFYMFPAFASTANFASSGSLAGMVGRENAGRMEYINRDAVAACYGDGALIVELMVRPGGPPAFDGVCHRAAITLINSKFGKEFREADVLGWSLRPYQQGVGYLIRYSSGRNEGKFPPRPEPTNKDDLDYQLAMFSGTPAQPPLDRSPERKAARDAREKRDLPKAWAEWIREVLMSKLMLVFKEELSHIALQILNKDEKNPQTGRLPTRGGPDKPAKWARADIAFPRPAAE